MKTDFVAKKIYSVAFVSYIEKADFPQAFLGQRPLVPLLLLLLGPLFPIFLFSPTALQTMMTGISLHMAMASDVSVAFYSSFAILISVYFLNQILTDRRL
jgi:hypothetical protein